MKRLIFMCAVAVSVAAVAQDTPRPKPAVRVVQPTSDQQVQARLDKLINNLQQQVAEVRALNVKLQQWNEKWNGTQARPQAVGPMTRPQPGQWAMQSRQQWQQRQGWQGQRGQMMNRWQQFGQRWHHMMMCRRHHHGHHMIHHRRHHFDNQQGRGQMAPQFPPRFHRPM